MAYSLRYFFRLLGLLTVQILFCNHIHLFGYATPLLIVYLLVSMEKGMSRVALLLWGFSCGILYDMFSNTAGMAASGMTLLGMMQPTLLASFSSRESEERMVPTVKNMGFWSFVTYTFVCMFIVHSIFYLFDAFMLSNFQLTIISTIASSVLATILALFVEMVTSPSSQER